MARNRLQLVAIVLLGMILALALGVFAHTIAGRTVALPATTLSTADAPLAPAQAKRVVRAKPKKKPKKAVVRAAPTRTATTPVTTDDRGGDDHSGRGRGRGRGSDDSGGSGSYGKGGDDD